MADFIFTKSEKVRPTQANFDIDVLYYFDSDNVSIYFKDINKEYSIKKLYSIGINIKNSEIYCFMFDNSRRFKFEFSYKVSNKELKKFINDQNLSKYKLVDDYGTAVVIIASYISVAKNRPTYHSYDIFYPIFSKLNIPSELKKDPGVIIYRGLKLSKEVIEKIIKYEKFSLIKRKLSSWTTDKKIAYDFIKRNSDGGIILKQKSVNTLINLSGDDKYVKAIRKLSHLSVFEKEVIIKGNGNISSITRNDLESIYLGKNEIK